MSCSLCKNPTVETLDFEAGNNAEFASFVRVCEVHLDEYDKDEWAFRDKYAAKIDDLAYESLIDIAEARSER
jgi:hypothetical protein